MAKPRQASARTPGEVLALAAALKRENPVVVGEGTVSCVAVTRSVPASLVR